MLFQRLGGLLGTAVADSSVLRIQVFQGPALQCEFQTPLARTCRVRLGKSQNIELPLPFSLFPNDVLLFSVTKWGARVYLDPRIDGFVSDGQRFGEVRDFIAPRGALKELASILEPLEVSIPLGSRGALEISGYTVVFRVEKIKPQQPRAKIKGAPKAPFALPESQSMLEKTGFLFGVLATILVTVPAVHWLNKAPLKEFRSISDLSPHLAAEIIHADHFQILPWVFGQEFNSPEIVSQSLIWVDELRKKWSTEDLGLKYETSLPQLRGFSSPRNVALRRKGLADALDEEWNQVAQQRDSAALGNFVKGQTSYAPMRVVVSGGERGSLSERVRARLEKLNKTHAAVVSLIETEHAYLKGHFGTMNAEINQIFDPPKEPGLFFRLSEKSFSIERDNFHVAESFAALARGKQKPDYLNVRADAPANDNEAVLVWSKDSLTLPSVLNSSFAPIFSGSEDELLKNARLSLGTLAPPPVPKPVAKIDMREVEAYVRGRSAEVKSCYDVALSRNPRLGGSVVWRWTIAGNGRVVRAKVANSSIGDPRFLKCLEEKIKVWNLPRPVNGAITISFPFRFVVRENIETLERIAR